MLSRYQWLTRPVPALHHHPVSTQYQGSSTGAALPASARAMASRLYLAAAVPHLRHPTCWSLCTQLQVHEPAHIVACNRRATSQVLTGAPLPAARSLHRAKTVTGAAASVTKTVAVGVGSMVATLAGTIVKSVSDSSKPGAAPPKVRA
jgi:hypothetical protein